MDGEIERGKGRDGEIERGKGRDGGGSNVEGNSIPDISQLLLCNVSSM